MKTGDKILVAATITGPVQTGDKWKDNQGNEIELNNDRGNKFWAQLDNVTFLICSDGFTDKHQIAPGVFCGLV